MNKNTKKRKNNSNNQIQNQKEDKKSKKPLFKIFMDENNKKKLHLIKSNISNSKDFQSNWKNCEGDKYFQNYSLDLQLFSFKILEAKHNSTPELYLNKCLNILIKKKKCHLLAYFNEMSINTSNIKEYLKRYYLYKETKERIPKYVSYYKNYLTYFCKPFFISYTLNKKMTKHMEKVAQIFYNENYGDDEEKDENEKNQKKEKDKSIEIFTKKIIKEIEKCDACTFVNSETAMNQIQLINKKIIKNNEIKKIENINNLNNNNSSTIVDNNYKITPIYLKDEQKNKIISQNKKSNDLILTQTNNSLSLIIDELDKKENNIIIEKKEKEKKDSIKKIKKIFSDNNDKENDIIKKLNNNCIVIKEGKTTNNINININHLTIGQKLISQNDNCNKIINGLVNLNNNINGIKINNKSNKKIIKRLKYKDNNINSIFHLKEKTTNQKFRNYIESVPQRNSIKDKNKNNSLTLLPPSQNMNSTYQTNLTKKFMQITPNKINSNKNHLNNINNYSIKVLKETRNHSILRGAYNTGSMTSLHKYDTNNNTTKEKSGIITIYTNNTNYLKNIINNINHGTTKIKKKKNIFFNKGILSSERTRSTNSMEKRPKKVFNSILKFNGGNLHLLNFRNNFGTNKITKDNKIINFPHSKKEIIPIINKNEGIFNKIYNKGLKINDLKGKHLNIHKILNIAPIKRRTKSTDK